MAPDKGEIIAKITPDPPRCALMPPPKTQPAAQRPETTLPHDKINASENQLADQGLTKPVSGLRVIPAAEF